MAHALRSLRRSLLLRLLGMLGPRRRRIVGWHALADAGVDDVTFESNGLRWTAPCDGEPVGFGLFVDGHYHGGEITALLAWMERSGVLAAPRDVVVDVGAHIGSTCIPLVRAASCRALAIEPVAASFRRLTANVAANAMGDRILLSRTAVLRAPGRAVMRVVPGASGGSFVWRDVGAAEPADGAPPLEDVAASPLGDILAAAGIRAEEVALVWADVQGCEADVIESGAALWELGVPLWAEIEPSSLARQGSVATFVRLAGDHFERFIESRELIRHGAAARPSPVAELTSLMRAIPEQHNTDVLLLPARLVSQRG